MRLVIRPLFWVGKCPCTPGKQSTVLQCIFHGLSGCAADMQQTSVILHWRHCWALICVIRSCSIIALRNGLESSLYGLLYAKGVIKYYWMEEGEKNSCLWIFTFPVPDINCLNSGEQRPISQFLFKIRYIIHTAFLLWFNSIAMVKIELGIEKVHYMSVQQNWVTGDWKETVNRKKIYLIAASILEWEMW